MTVFNDLGFALAGGTYKGPQIAVYPLIFCEICGIYPRRIRAISGSVPTALAYLSRKAGKLPKIWFLEATPELLYKELKGRSRQLRLVYRLFREKGSGLFKGEFLEGLIDREVDFEKIFDSPVELFIGVTALHGKGVEWHSLRGHGMNVRMARELVLASMMEPVAFEPRCIDEKQWADAGHNINFPLTILAEDGFTTIVGVSSVPRVLNDLPRGKLNIREIDFRCSDINHAHELNRELEFFRRIDEQRQAAGERPIALHCITPPSDALFFQKSEKTSYGDPSPEARMEMLIIGMAAIPALSKFFYEQGILEHKVDWQLKTDLGSFRQHRVFGRYFS